MNVWKLFAATLPVLSLASSAVAAGESASGGEPNLFGGTLGNAVWTLLIFGTLLVILGKYAWGPIMLALQRREDLIRDSLDKAKRQRDEAAPLLKKHTEQLQHAQAQAQQIGQQARADAEEARRQLLADAQAEARRMTDQARAEIESAREQAVKELFDQAAMLATTTAGRIVGRE